MSKRRDKVFNQMYANADEEVNTTDYPYYRTIPIQSVSIKQKQMLDKFKIVKEVTRVSETILPAQPVYQSPQPQPVYEELPTFNLVKVEGTNIYKVDMPLPLSEDLKKQEQQRMELEQQRMELEQQQVELEQEIRKNADIIEGQKQAVATNELTLQEQAGQIQSNNVAIQHNHHYIQQQIAAFNHNSGILTNQYNQYNLNNAEIMKQQETLNTQYNQITEYQAQIQYLQSEMESYQQQLAYHGTMITAFNTLIQNPQYFTQLMAAAASISPDMMAEITDIKPYDENTT